MDTSTGTGGNYRPCIPSRCRSTPDVSTDKFAKNQIKGERSFINTIGACCNYTPDSLCDSLFKADGRELVPRRHADPSVNSITT